MGISAGTVKLLAQTVARRRLGGAALTLGVQGINAKYPDLEYLLDSVGFQYVKPNAGDIRTDTVTQWKGNVHQETLFRMLGFSVTESIDVYSDENPTYQLNLNEPVSASLEGRFDFLYDGGTMEHCFDVRSVLSNCVRLLKIGGVVTHHVPMSGSIDHGFYQYCPTVFFDFYSANGFEELDLKIHFSDGCREYYVDYDYPGAGAFPGHFDFGPRYIFFTARKRENVEEITVPIQNRYRKMYGDRKPSGIRAAGNSADKKLRRRLLKFLFPRLYQDILDYEHFWINRRRVARRIEKMKRNAVVLRTFGT